MNLLSSEPDYPPRATITVVRAKFLDPPFVKSNKNGGFVELNRYFSVGGKHVEPHVDFLEAPRCLINWKTRIRCARI